MDEATQTVRDILAQPNDAAQNVLLLAGQCLVENARIGDAVRQECLKRLETLFQNTTDPLLFARVATTLANIGGEDVALYFERAVKNSNVPVRVVAIQALGTMSKRIPPERIKTTLMNVLQDKHVPMPVSRSAIVALAQLEFEKIELVEALRALYRTHQELVVREAAKNELLWSGHAAEFGLIQVPAGAFVMGTNDGSDNEKPPHTVYLDEYFIGCYPVTNAEYKQFVVATKHPMPKHWNNGTIPLGKENHPVTYVSWEDAVVYCEWAGMRLPTEAEWEKAASWDEAKKAKRNFPWGDVFDASKCNSSESQISDTTSVGKYSPQGDSSYGAIDMAGNVWEWCADWYAEDYYKNSPAQNPKGPDSGKSRVLRGGSWLNYRNFVRAAFRGWFYPEVRDGYRGFRVVAGAS